jgi:hypothetical protein
MRVNSVTQKGQQRCVASSRQTSLASVTADVPPSAAPVGAVRYTTLALSLRPHILTSSRPHILTSSHPHILTSSRPPILARVTSWGTDDERRTTDDGRRTTDDGAPSRHTQHPAEVGGYTTGKQSEEAAVITACRRRSRC